MFKKKLLILKMKRFNEMMITIVNNHLMDIIQSKDLL